MRQGRFIETIRKFFVRFGYFNVDKLNWVNQMKVVHRVSLTPDESQRKLLASLQVQLIESKSPLVRLVTFEIMESDALWPKVKSLIDLWNPVDFVRTEFSESERGAASYLQVLAGLQGYPQPESAFRYLNETYDLTNYCQRCGIGAKQASSFRMKGEPKWGKNHVFQLNWVCDEFFVQPKIWENVFEPLGIGHLSVLDHRTGSKLATVVQLQSNSISDSAILIDGTCPTEVCLECGRKKFHPIVRGFFPAFEGAQSFHFGRTQEFFGSGGSGWRATVMSQVLYQAIRAHKVAGFIFHPLSG